MVAIDETLTSRIQALVRLLDVDGLLMVRFDPTEAMPLGLMIHHGKRDDAVSRLIKQATPDQRQGRRIAIFRRERLVDARALRIAIIAGLERVARLPIGLRHVERLLGITSAERSRWTKAGRLPVSGSATISKGPNTISIPTYSPTKLEKLLLVPDTISAWRAADIAEIRLAASAD